MFLQQYIKGLLQLLYPKLCATCATDAINKHQIICWKCAQSLPNTYYANIINNPVERIFEGRIPVVAATSCLFFNKGSAVQHLLHLLKYKKQYAVGEYLGNLLGEQLANSPRFATIDAITPIPITAKRLQTRGYNQALAICNGVAQVMHKPIISNLTIRTVHSASLTTQTREQRWQSMQQVFAINNANELHGKNILLVDDVITTGATLEACGSVLLQVPSVKLYLATAAMANMNL